MNFYRASASNWWVTNDSDKLGLHVNNVGDKFYFSTAGDFYSDTNGWLSTALAAKQNASTAITTSNIGSQSVSVARQLLSPNDATVVAADSAMPSAGHSFIHTLAQGPGGNDGHILGMTWAGTTSIYGAQIFLDTDPTDTMAIRSRSNAGVWTSWKTVIHSGNIASQSVNYATSAGSASTAGFSDEAKWISYPDGPRDLSDRSPSWNNRSVAWDFVGAGTANGSGNYGGVMTFVPWDGTSASTGDSSYQLAFANTTGVNASGQPKLSIRNGINSTWNAWYTLIHSGNIGSQSVTYATSAGSAGTAGSAGSVDGLTLTSSANNLNPNNVTQNQIGYNTSVSLFGQTDGGLYSSAYSSEWIHQIFGDFRTGQVAIRGKNANTWGDWRLVVDDKNIGTYAVPYGNMTSSTGLNDNKLYLRTNGDNNHYLWNAADDWEELVYYNGTGFRVKGATGTVSATFTDSGISIGTSSTLIRSFDAQGYLRIYGSSTNYLGIGPYNNNGWVYFENSGNANGIYFNSPGRYAFDSVDVTPYNDAENSLGNGSYRWAQIYTSGWLRQYGAQGMYNQDYGTHFYSNGATSWAITGSGGNIQLEFRSNHQSTIRGFVYADTSNNIGFLSEDGNWVLRTFNRGVEAYGSMRAPIFYDSNDTYYYVDPNSTSRLVSTRIIGGELRFQNGQYYNNLEYWGARMFSQDDGNGVPLYVQVQWVGGWYNALKIASGLDDNNPSLRTYRTTQLATDAGNVSIGGTASSHKLHVYGTAFATSDFRAPIFYDSADTNYYGDFAGTSRFNATVTDTSYFGANSSKGRAQGFGTNSSSLHKIGHISFDWDANYDGYQYHGIASTDYTGGFSDSVSINSFNDITFRLDSNGNNGASYVRFMNDTTGNNTFSSLGYDGSIYYAQFGRDLYVDGNRGGNFGNRLVIGGSSTPYTMQDGNIRPTAYLRGAYPVLTLDHTETNNAEHGPTIQFVFNGSNARQWLIGCGGSGNFMDFGFSSSSYGNTNYNPHNGISGYQGNTIMRIIDSRVGIGGDWGTYGSVANPEYTLDVRGTIFSNTDMRAPIFYDSADTSYYLDPNADLSLKVYGEICNSNYQAGRLQPGALNIGRTDLNYAWEGGTWADDVRVGILANCSETWEIAVHDSGDAVKSLIHFDGGSTITMGRDIGWSTCVVNSPSGYVSNGNPWGTANSAFFPNGITTAGSANWIYGTTTYIGNAPSNGAGHDFSSSGHQYSTGSITTPLFLVNGHSDNTKGYRIHNTSGSSVSAMFTNSSNQLVIAAGAVDQINLNKKVYVNGVALGVNVAPSATAGRIDASNDIVAYSSSDERLKENITPIENALEKVKSLTGVEFDWKPEHKEAHGHEGHDTGIIAQQVLGVMPTAVRTNDTGYFAVRYEKLIGLLIEANKELAARVEELEKKLG
jgi:hypothetical protein